MPKFIVNANLTEILFLYIPIFLISVVVIISTVKKIIISTYRKHSRKYKDCAKCKNLYLSGVSGSGGYCHYRCQERDDIEINTDMNSDISSYFVECDKFESEKPEYEKQIKGE